MQSKYVLHLLKVLITCLFIAGMSSSSHGQSWKELWERADSLHSVQEVDSAIAVGRIAVLEAEKRLGAEDTIVAKILGLVIACHFEKAEYAEVEGLISRQLSVHRGVGGHEHVVAIALRGLGDIHQAQGEYGEAEEYYLQALEICEKLPADRECIRAFILTNLGQLYRRMGRLSEAESLIERSLEIHERVRGPRHSLVGQCLHQLAVVYRRQGRLVEAIRSEQQALEIRKEYFGLEHFDVASSMNDLANYYWELGRYDEAEPLQSQALIHLKKVLGSGHPWVGYAMNDLARIIMSQGRYDSAGSLYREALRILEDTLGPEHPGVAISWNGLGRMCTRLLQYVTAERCFQKALAIREQALGSDHYLMAETLEDLSVLRRVQGNIAPAIKLAERAVAIRRKNFLDNAVVLSERDALTYSQLLRNSVDNYISCFVLLESPAQMLVNKVADEILMSKGQVSDRIFQRQKKLVSETDSATLTVVENLRQVKTQLSRLYVSSFADDFETYKTRLDSLNDLAREVEADLSGRSASFRRQRYSKNASSARISSLLPEGSVLVEYVKYNRSKSEPDSVIPHYLALTIDNSGDVALLDLGQAAEIEQLIDSYRRHMIQMTETAGLPSGDDEQGYRRIAKDLCARLWKPIERFTWGKNQLFVAPDAGLNLISFATLVDDDGRYLIERALIHNLSAGRDILRLQVAEGHATGLFAFGAPDYNATVEQRISATEEQNPVGTKTDDHSHTRETARACDVLVLGSVPALPLSRYEVQEIARAWEGISDEPMAIFYDADANEGRFKAEAPGYRVIHLATHGYYISGSCWPDEGNQTNGMFAGDHPLLLSGLYLAGCNLRGQAPDSVTVDDGILTALEISSMNLGGTDLVVLSACETGLGSVQEGEGVYGLRRAFQMAGARTVISSLWPVSDRITAVFMRDLYRVSGESLPARLRCTQLSMINDMRSKGLSDHPVSWGAFIISGDWR